MRSKKLLGLPVHLSDLVPPAGCVLGQYPESGVVCDVLGQRVSIDDLLITARGELLTALETPSSIWLRGHGIAVADRKGVRTYRPASMLLRAAPEAGWHLLSEKERAHAFAVNTERFREGRRLELRARRGFKH